MSRVSSIDCVMLGNATHAPAAYPEPAGWLGVSSSHGRGGGWMASCGKAASVTACVEQSEGGVSYRPRSAALCAPVLQITNQLASGHD